VVINSRTVKRDTVRAPVRTSRVSLSANISFGHMDARVHRRVSDRQRSWYTCIT